MQVLKFGGTSVGSSESIRSLSGILKPKLGEDDIFVVVSAMSGVTNALISIIRQAESGDKTFISSLNSLREKHLTTANELVGESEDLSKRIHAISDELEELINGIATLKEATVNARNQVVGFGERVSSLIIHAFLSGQFEDVALIDPVAVLTCHLEDDQVHVLMEESQKKLTEIPIGRLAICPGFIAGDEHGKLLTLGRGGSDYSAALFANLLNAESLEIWTDVNGLMTADPRLVSGAKVIQQLSYEEALELSHFGAKVIYPPSIQPAMTKGIPIQIKNTFDPKSSGTSITKGYSDESLIRGISIVEGISLLNLKGAGMVGIPNFSYRLFQTLSENQINVILITQASSEHTICVGIDSKEIKKAEKAVNKVFSYEIADKKLDPVKVENDLGIVALVGSSMKNQVGISGQMFSTLGSNGISIKAIAQGSSERNISCVVDQKDLTKAINSLHESFFENEIKRVNLFIVGVGNVGKALLNQIKQQQTYLLEEHHLNLQVIALANSKKVACDITGISLDSWNDELETGDPYEMETFISMMTEANLRNSIFLDMTASSEVASYYQRVLMHSISIATPNKIAATNEYSSYVALKRTEKKYKTHFLFETNVCAGLPVISTLRDLVKSGDQVHKIEAVLSGTLNFLFNNYTGAESFSTIVRRAKDEGYSEPDPRLDLSGEDVKRKILILSRESGYKMEMAEVKSEAFVPDNAMNATDVEDFLTRLENEEEHFQELYSKSKKENKKIRYVATFEGGAATTELKYVDETHPFYHLEGSDNIVLFYTERYSKQPLVVKGAGAGAEVTASGVFGDIMKISSN